MNKIKVKKYIPKSPIYLKLNNDIFWNIFPNGLVKNSLTMFYGKSGTGKTCFISEICLDLLKSKYKIWWLFTKGINDLTRLIDYLESDKDLLKNLFTQRIKDQNHLKDLVLKNKEIINHKIDLIIIDNIYSLIDIEVIDEEDKKIKIKKAINLLFKILYNLKKYSTVIIVDNIFEKEVFKLNFNKFDINFMKNKIKLDNEQSFINCILNKSINSTIYHNDIEIENKSFSYLLNELNNSYNELSEIKTENSLEMIQVNTILPKLRKSVKNLELESDISEIVEEDIVDESSKEHSSKTFNKLIYNNSLLYKDIKYYTQINENYYSKNQVDYYFNNSILNELIDTWIFFNKKIKNRFIKLKFSKYYKNFKYKFIIRDNEVIIN